MTFGIDAFDWTKVNEALRKHAETFYAPAVGDSWLEATPATTIAILTDFETPVLPQFDYYDGETDTVQDIYEVYLWHEDGDWDIVTTKTTEGATTVVNVTPLTLLYLAYDDEGNQTVTNDDSDSSIESNEDGLISEPPLTSGSADANTMYTEEIQEVFDNDIDTDTAWTPDYVLGGVAWALGGGGAEVYLKESATNSDTTAWYRIKSRNGQETIHWFLQTDSGESDWAAGVPEEFTYGTGTPLFRLGLLGAMNFEEGKVHEVAGTSLNYVGLGSTYDSAIADLSTAYDALGAGIGLAGPCADKPNSTFNDSTGECDCDTDYEEDAAGTCVSIAEEPSFLDSIGVWFSSTGDSIKQGLTKHKNLIIGGVVLAVASPILMKLWKWKSRRDTVGEQLDDALGSGKELEN